jgi:hypothetical protein
VHQSFQTRLSRKTAPVSWQSRSGRNRRARSAVVGAMSNWPCSGYGRSTLRAAVRSRARNWKAAADVVWGFLIQRELCGLRDRDQVIRDYAVPKEVLVRLGVR